MDSWLDGETFDLIVGGKGHTLRIKKAIRKYMFLQVCTHHLEQRIQ
jgi:hypothetical protein